MSEIVAEWIDKAEGDWMVAEREWRARKNLSYDAVCFHAQQCAEKYLKARLQDAEVNPPKMHDLLALLDRTSSLEPAWGAFRDALSMLSEYAVKFRYPGESATREEAGEAIRAIRLFRKHVRPAFGLD